MRRAETKVSITALIIAGLLALPVLVLPQTPALTRVYGVLIILSAAAFFFAARTLVREISISRRLGMLLVLSGVGWGSVVLASGGGMEGSGAEGDRFRLLRSMDRDAVADAAMQNADTVRGMLSLSLPGTGGAVLNAIGDATGATLGVIVGTVFSASAMNENRGADEPGTPGRTGRPLPGMLISMGAMVTMIAVLEGLVMVDRTRATHAVFLTSAGAVFLHGAVAAVGAGGIAVATVMRSPLSLTYLLVLVASVAIACCQRWIRYLNRRSMLFTAMGALLFAEFCRRAVAVSISEGVSGYGCHAVNSLMGAAALLLAVYGYGSLLSILLHMPSARLLDRRYTELNTLQDLSHSLHSSFEPGQLSTAATRLGKRLTGADCCWIVPESPNAGFPGVWCGDGNDFTDDIPPEWYASISARLDSASRGFLLNNYRRTSLEKLLPGRGRIGSLMAAQVEARGERLGVLLAACGRSFRFVDHTRGLFDSFARQIAQAFHNARLFGEKLELEKLHRELDLAREIQQQLFPTVIHQPPGYEIAAQNIPCSVVGGDYYDVIPLEDGRTALVIADVAGKGAAASILMAGLQAGLRSLLLSNSGLPELVPLLNRLVCGQVPDGTFITMFLGVLDSHSGTMEYCNAGHDPPIVIHADGAITRPLTGGLVFGVDPGAAYECDRVVFEPGCRMVLYTDGVTDAFSASSEEPFGIDRLGSAIARHATVPSRDLLRTLNRLLDSWVGNEPHTDDVTMMAVRRVDTGRRGEHN